MNIELKLEGRLQESLRELRDQRLPEARREFVKELATVALQETRRLNPVDTGRSRDGWVLPGADGGGEAAGEGTSTVDDSSQVTTVTATNAVPYIVYLEYGTSRMAPVAMVRKALSQARSQIASLFRLTQGR